jgi:UDP-N-acetylmuramoylalanine--D-glutamate ligase
LGPAFPESPAGYDLVAVSPGVPIDHPLLAEARARGIRVEGELGLSARELAIPFVAVTGTNGKTTTSELAAHMLGGLGFRPFLGGNIGRPLADLVGGAAAGGFDSAVLEVSSFQLETALDLRPKGAAILNLSPDHLDRHKDMASYLALKARILGNQGPGDVAVLNLDDPALSGLRPRARLFGFSRGGDPGPFGARVLREGKGEVLRVFEGGSLAHEEPLGPKSRLAWLKGAHNQENLMAALGLARALGGGFAGALGAAGGYRPGRHRVELVGEFGGVAWYDDSKGTNPGAVAAALANFPDSRVILIMGGRDKGMDFSSLRGPVRAKARLLVLIGEAAGRIEGALKGATRVAHAGSMGGAVGISKAEARPGDAVLLSPACASFDMFKDYKDRGDSFRREALRANGLGDDGGRGAD